MQVMSKASRTVPDGGEMLHEGGLGSKGASVTAGSVGSGPGIGKVYLAKPGSFLPVTKKKTCFVNQFISVFQSQMFEIKLKLICSFEQSTGFQKAFKRAQTSIDTNVALNLHLKRTL